MRWVDWCAWILEISILHLSNQTCKIQLLQFSGSAVFWDSSHTRVWLFRRLTHPKYLILGSKDALWEGTTFYASSFPKIKFFGCVSLWKSKTLVWQLHQKTTKPERCRSWILQVWFGRWRIEISKIQAHQSTYLIKAHLLVRSVSHSAKFQFFCDFRTRWPQALSLRTS